MSYPVKVSVPIWRGHGPLASAGRPKDFPGRPKVHQQSKLLQALTVGEKAFVLEFQNRIEFISPCARICKHGQHHARAHRIFLGHHAHSDQGIHQRIRAGDFHDAALSLDSCDGSTGRDASTARLGRCQSGRCPGLSRESLQVMNDAQMGGHLSGVV